MSLQMSPKMSAVRFDPGSLKLSLVRAERPGKVAEHEVLVEVAFSGVCGTDLHIVEGHFPCSPRPVVLGHEFCGVAVAVGSKVTHVTIGDRVVVDPNSGCGCCCECRGGRYHYCRSGGISNTVGIWRDGGWAQLCLVPGPQAMRVPDKVTLEQAALTEPLSCVAHGWDRLQPLPVGTRVLIQGAGIIGNLWAVVLHLHGHRRVTVSEPQPARREHALKLGTGYRCVSPAELRAMLEAEPDGLFDVVVDCSGAAPALEECVGYLRHGGKLLVFGIAPAEARIRVSPFLLYQKELTITGVLINPFTFPKALGLIDAMGSRYLDYETLGIKMFPLAQYEVAMAQLKAGAIAKAVFKVK